MCIAMQGHAHVRHALRFTSLFLLCLWTASSRPAAEPGAEPGDDGWLDRLNFYRATASLPPVSENSALSGAVLRHARYMVMHSVVSHSENMKDAWATPEGAAAAAVSNLAGSTRPMEPDSWAVDVWMQAPFHALGILDPTLRQVGFGIAHQPQRKLIQTAAGLDVIRGRRADGPIEVSYPVVWPANGASVPLTQYAGEHPDPLTSCAGYQAPAGLPLIVQLGPGQMNPHVTASHITENGRPLAHCVFDEGSYRNRNGAEQRLGRNILASRDAIVLIPRKPLHPGMTYRATVSTNGAVIDWTFSVREQG
jgi:hypothetical protein